jgi:RNA polymerase sigma-70 factor (ECF subfamily)
VLSGRRAYDDAAANQAMDAYAEGDDAALGDLYNALGPRLYGFLLRRTRNVQHAEDLVQETFLNIHRARGQFARGADVVPWAFAIARRLCIDEARHGQRADEAHEREALPDVHSRDESIPDDWLFAREIAEKLEAELGQLPESQRAAFELLRIEGLSHAQAAQVLGTTVSAVKLRAHRAYERLHLALKEPVPT